MEISRRDILIISTGTLICLGLVMLASASLSIAENESGEAFHYLKRQIIFLSVGMVACFIVYQFPMELWNRFSGVFLGLGLLLLILVLIPPIGKEVNGSMRWIPLGPVNFQPSELAKVLLIIYLASYMVRHEIEVRSEWSGLLKPLGVIGFAMILLLAEPDFGSFVVIMVTTFTLFFLGGVQIKRFALILCSGIALGAILAVAEPYRMQRLINFIDPFGNDPYGSGYQLTQSLIAFGRGEWAGMGLGNGIQKLFYLPEAHTDFIFAVLSEELGLIGNLFVITLFMIVVFSSMFIGLASAEKGNLFSAYVAYGLSVLIGIQAIFNLGVNMGVLPTKGLALPFMSYGGSSLTINCLVLGLLLRIDKETCEQRVVKSRRKDNTNIGKASRNKHVSNNKPKRKLKKAA